MQLNRIWCLALVWLPPFGCQSDRTMQGESTTEPESSESSSPEASDATTDSGEGDPTANESSSTGADSSGDSTDDGPVPDLPPDAPAYEWVQIPGGSFDRGCVAGDPDCAADELPNQILTIADFELGRFEVTVAEYWACVESGPCSPSGQAVGSGSCLLPADGADYPQNCISWEQATEFCAWIGARLPTEAEWEYAARREHEGRFAWGTNAIDCDHAIYAGSMSAELCNVSGPQPVGERELGSTPADGIHDMTGNLAEFVDDWYAADYYSNAEENNPSGPDTGTFKVSRGGSYQHFDVYVRTTTRFAVSPPQVADGGIGVRCAR